MRNDVDNTCLSMKLLLCWENVSFIVTLAKCLSLKCQIYLLGEISDFQMITQDKYRFYRHINYRFVKRESSSRSKSKCLGYKKNKRV